MNHVPSPPPGRAQKRSFGTRVKHFFGDYFGVLRSREEPIVKRISYALRGFIVALSLVILGFVIYTLALIPLTPSVENLRAEQRQRPTRVLSADGQQLVLFKGENREWVTLDQVSPVMVDALLATEDTRFYEHSGIDLFRMMGAALKTAGGDTQGGSTINQQLARNAYPEEIGRAISIDRKLKEMLVAFKIELAFHKPEILEMYLNTVPFLFNAHGVEMAARTYFDVPASALDTLQSATLVGMLKGTSYYNPVLNPDRARSRRNVVLQRMYEEKMLTRAAFDTLRAQPLDLNFEVQPLRESKAPHFTEMVRSWLIDWADQYRYDIYRDGLVVHTTIDSTMQQLAQEAVARQGEQLQAVADVEWSRRSIPYQASSTDGYVSYRSRVRPFAYLLASKPSLVDEYLRDTEEYRKGREAGRPSETLLDSLRDSRAFVDSVLTMRARVEAGFVAIEPGSGYVRAWVGSRDFKATEFDHVKQARRQPGSTFKPFVYAAALSRGYGPDTILRDEGVEIRIDRNRVWRPANAGAITGRNLTLAQGLAYSKNTISAQLIADIGADRVARLAQQMGVRQSKLEAVPSLALGTSEVTLLEMATAYATIANEGVYHAPVFVTRIEDRHGRTLATFGQEREQVISSRTATTLLDMMRHVVTDGTARGLRWRFGIDGDVAGKTGTTQDGADGWFLLMHPQLVMGSWVGFPDHRIRFRSDYWGQGGHNALFVVGDFLKHTYEAEKLDPKRSFPPSPIPYEFVAPDPTPDWLVRFASEGSGPGQLVQGPDGLWRPLGTDDAPGVASARVDSILKKIEEERATRADTVLDNMRQRAQEASAANRAARERAQAEQERQQQGTARPATPPPADASQGTSAQNPAGSGTPAARPATPPPADAGPAAPPRRPQAKPDSSGTNV